MALLPRLPLIAIWKLYGDYEQRLSANNLGDIDPFPEAVLRKALSMEPVVVYHSFFGAMDLRLQLAALLGVDAAPMLPAVLLAQAKTLLAYSYPETVQQMWKTGKLTGVGLNSHLGELQTELEYDYVNNTAHGNLRPPPATALVALLRSHLTLQENGLASDWEAIKARLRAIVTSEGYPCFWGPKNDWLEGSPPIVLLTTLVSQRKADGFVGSDIGHWEFNAPVDYSGLAEALNVPGAQEIEDLSSRWSIDQWEQFLMLTWERPHLDILLETARHIDAI